MLRSSRKSRRSAAQWRDALLPAALGFALLWVAVVAISFANHRSPALLAVGGAGLLLTMAMLVMINRQHARLRGLAGTDALTGLVNHRGFHETLAAELERARREGTPLALVSLDLDDFKAVNDTHGHPYGDEVLRAVGEQLRGAVRTYDTAARVGGEEFALILPGARGERAHAVAERARQAVENVAVEGQALSCSAGIATFPEDAEDASTLCELADAALYWAKRGGKARTRRFDPDHVAIRSSERQETEIAELLGRANPIRAVFQPVIDLVTGTVIGYEALSRFPGHSRRSAAAWFAQAHACGLGPELEAAAIRAALQPLGRPIGTHLALNLSPSALSSDVVQAALPPDLSEVVIEITEHEFIPDDDTLGAVVAELRRRGARIAVDDAGAGYAGLKQVMRVRPDIVKLDRELTEGIHDDPARVALVESFVRFARRTGVVVCAEGVERLDDLGALTDLDVQWAQGYAIARPEPPWAAPSADAAEVCRNALERALRSTEAAVRSTGGDRGLERVSARLAAVRSPGDVERVVAMIAEELNADQVTLSQWHEGDGVVETLIENAADDGGDTSFPVREYPLTAQVLRDQCVVQVLAGDPRSDPHEVRLMLELGHRSLLMVPVVCRGESLGLVEAFSVEERPWSRTEITRARIIANQFASVIEAFFRAPAPEAR